MSDEDSQVRITLRLPSELHADLAKEAESGSRSLNAEVIRRLSRGAAASFEPSMQMIALEQRLKGTEVVAEAYRAASESASTTIALMMDRLEQLAGELPKDHHLAQQTMALVNLMRSSAADGVPGNQDRFASVDLTHSVEIAPRRASTSKK